MTRVIKSFAIRDIYMHNLEVRIEPLKLVLSLENVSVSYFAI
jgi:hypothetical protein